MARRTSAQGGPFARLHPLITAGVLFGHLTSKMGTQLRGPIVFLSCRWKAACALPGCQVPPPPLAEDVDSPQGRKTAQERRGHGRGGPASFLAMILFLLPFPSSSGCEVSLCPVHSSPPSSDKRSVAMRSRSCAGRQTDRQAEEAAQGGRRHVGRAGGASDAGAVGLPGRREVGWGDRQSL
ncbi:hypothetical protein GGTG_03895 [Gaeumannomyces tritici R3-111a-1]|uniref:Uncharacterized protein n=1 Tax=Gaeumannomyces tritici (strain R3-111a-1) TaxID=644352 RepID=J3NRJ1_GAET3|nr:hypothetical protein GGTG_03895 [Gaeumannomyces tritici R3-111a-1]EJT78797.1 hypothetical protein GGTG_03895 [Gaeumannomyces tritici R3-111a-1]